MGKTDCLNELENVKSRLYERINQIKFAINDAQHTKDLKKLDDKNCSLCAMMQDNVQFRSSNMGASHFEELELLHSNIHEDFNKIIDALATPTSKGLVSKLIRPNAISSLDLEKIKSYYDDLGNTVDNTVNMLERIMRRVHALNESRWEDQKNEKKIEESK